MGTLHGDKTGEYYTANLKKLSNFEALLLGDYWQKPIGILSK